MKVGGTMELLQDLRGYQEAFGAEDVTSLKMKQAIMGWFEAYYDQQSYLQLPMTVVRKLTRAVLAEYAPECSAERIDAVLKALPARRALQLAFIGGECYLKPVFGGKPQWRTVARGDILIFSRDWRGEPTDVGLMERSRVGKQHYTLLERRTVDPHGLLTVRNRLFRSGSPGALGREVSLREHPDYAGLPARYTYPRSIGSVGLVRVCTPMVNCVDASHDGVSVYAAAMELVRAIEENEQQLQGEFRRGQSRLVVSRDLLDRGQLKDDLFVALDESPDTVGITVFAPMLRQQSYLERQQAYLRAVENIIGLKRGLLSQVEAVDRTATEITSSEGEYMTTIRELQQMWENAAIEAVRLWCAITGEPEARIVLNWGDGVV